MNSSAANVTVIPLPAPWQAADIGYPGLIGSTAISAGVYTVSGAGVMGGTADSLRFVYQPVGLAGAIYSKISAINVGGTNSCVGIMLRESVSPASSYVFVGLATNGVVRFQARTATGGNTISTLMSSTMIYPPNSWMLLARSYDIVYAEVSVDGLSWSLVNYVSAPMSSTVYAGFAVASGVTNRLDSGTFTSLTLQP
jgi:hypothetical protein